LSPKIIISPSSIKKNGLNHTNGTITKSITPRTSPKFFKTQTAAPDDDDGDVKVQIKFEIDDEVQTNHSIASQSVSELAKHHASGRKGENDISGITATTTGIKQEILEEFTGKSRESSDKSRRKQQRKNNRSTTKNVVIEPLSDVPRSAPQFEWINRNFLENLMTRDERLKLKKSYLRNVLDRHESLHQTRKERREISKRHFVKTCKLLKTMNREREEM
jgi:hypothetical protein